MGLEECKEEDGECMKRRVVAEAHLDYIYTQDHNHPWCIINPLRYIAGVVNKLKGLAR